MLQLIFVIFLITASGERVEQRYVYKDEFRSVAECKAKGVEITSHMAAARAPEVRGFAFVCVEPGVAV